MILHSVVEPRAVFEKIARPWGTEYSVPHGRAKIVKFLSQEARGSEYSVPHGRAVFHIL